MVALGLALGASIAWGGSDFLAGLVARRLPVLTLLVLSQGAGLLLLLLLLALAGQAALAFGLFFVATNAASDSGGVAWTVVVNRSYPVTTVALAAIVLRERPRALQGLGVAGVLVGIGLVSAWGA